MIEKLYPKMYFDTIYDIPYAKLLEKNFKGLIFDIDNTLAPFDVEEPDPKAIQLMRRLKSLGFQLCLLSNGSRKRVARFNQKLQLPAIHRAKKPLPSGARKAMKKIGTSHDNTVLIGDQVFTDILCGNAARLTTILVKQMSDRDEFTVRIKRNLEKKVVERYIQQGGKAGYHD